jgi:hypothetical protein
MRYGTGRNARSRAVSGTLEFRRSAFPAEMPTNRRRTTEKVSEEAAETTRKASGNIAHAVRRSDRSE